MVAKLTNILGSSGAAGSNPSGGSPNAPFVGTGAGNTQNSTGFGTMMTDKGPVLQGSQEKFGASPTGSGNGLMDGLRNNRHVGALGTLAGSALGASYPGAGLLMSALQHGRKGGLGINSLFDNVPGSYGAIPGVARDIGYNVSSLGGLTSLFDGKPGAGGMLGAPIEALNTLSGVGSLFDNKAGSTGAIGAIMSLLGMNQGPNPTYNNVDAQNMKMASEATYANSGTGYASPNEQAKEKAGALSGGVPAAGKGVTTTTGTAAGPSTGGMTKATGTSVGGGKAGGSDGPIKDPKNTKKR